MIDVVEASIADLRAALESGAATAVGLVEAYLARIAAYDTPGPSTSSGAENALNNGTELNNGTALNAVVVHNPDALAEAAASDARRAAGRARG
ncbi:MAG: amidase, partial [Microbacterium sp.]